MLPRLELRLKDADGSHPTPFPVFDPIVSLLSPKSTAPPRPYISNVCVAARCQRRGVARALMAAAEYVAGPRGWGYDSAFLHVHETNGNALDLYESSGYEELDALHAAPLKYFYKKLSPDAPDRDEVVAAALGTSPPVSAARR